MALQFVVTAAAPSQKKYSKQMQTSGEGTVVSANDIVEAAKELVKAELASEGKTTSDVSFNIMYQNLDNKPTVVRLDDSVDLEDVRIIGSKRHILVTVNMGKNSNGQQ